MPELPDVLLYLHALEPRVVGRPIEKVRLASPFLLRSVGRSVQSVEGRIVSGLRRLGKRIVFELEGGAFLVFQEQAGAAFPEKVTAFHPEMRVHGRFRASQRLDDSCEFQDRAERP